MVAIPTVKSFCGCCDLRVACVAIASVRLVFAIIVLMAIISYFLIFGFIFHKIDKSESHKNDDYVAFQILAVVLFIWFIVLIPVILINILFSYWFIRGVNSKDTNKMKYYVYMEAVNVCMLGLRFLFAFDLNYFVSAAFECYIAICSYSLYKEFLNGSPDDAENTIITFHNNLTPPPQYTQGYDTENTVLKIENNPEAPPRYSSCEMDKDINVQNTGVYPNVQNTGVYPNVQNTGVYPKLNP